jgi:hypothetical protein
VNCPVHSTAAQQGVVGGVYNGINGKSGDIGFDNRNI